MGETLLRTQALNPLRRERGFAIPILAVMSLAVIATLAILGLDTARTKDAATLLRGTAERICKNVAREASRPHEAVGLFSREVNKLIPLSPFVRVVEARLVLPFPLEGSGASGISGVHYQFGNPQASTCNPTFRAFKPSSPSNEFPLPFSSIQSGLRCENQAAAPTLTDCELHYSICDYQPNAAPLPNYPPSMWSDIRNAGNTVGCELAATVENTFGFAGANRRVSAKVAWAIPLRVREPYHSNTSLVAGVPSSYAGLSLGIATQMTTWAGVLPSSIGGLSGYDNRFNFTAYPPALSIYDPRRVLSSGPAPTQRLNFRNGVVSSHSLLYPAIFGITPPIVIPPAIQLLDNAGSPSRGSEEFLTACVNPLVLIRNMIASTLVELAARHGQTRNLTQVTSINSRHKGSWASPNRPVDIVQFGQDLTAELYQHPFVTFFSDDSSAATQTLGGLQSGFVLPWADNPNTNSPRYQTDTARLKRDTFLAQQLRYCLHLWDFDLVQRPKLPLHVELARFLPREFGFSFSLQDTAGAVDAGIYDHWDYGDPWGQLPPNNPTVSRLLNAAEVVQSLGSTQLCPAPGSPQNEFDCKGNQFSPTNDLEPDLYAYLAHQLGPLQSYPSPGLFHPVDNSNVPVTNENDISSVQPMYRAPNSIPAYPAKSVVVIITTKGLRDPPASPYHQSLKGAVQALNTLGRPVIIVFIPATGADSNTTPNFCEILRRGNTCSSPELGAENNRLFLLSPYAADYGQFYIGSTEGATFINYWEDLLINSTNKSQDLYAASIAETIFLDAITGLTPKL